MRWKTIKGYEGLYSVSDTGIIRAEEKRDLAGKTRKAKILKKSVWEGYERVQLFDKSGKKRMHRIHRLVAEAFLDNPENKEQVNHDDHNRSNNCVENLTWMTASENMQWMALHGRTHTTRGEKHHMVDKKDSVVREVKTLYDTGEYTQTELSKRFGVSVSTINYWVRGIYR